MIETAIAVDLIKDAGYAGFVAFFYGGGDSGDFEAHMLIPREFIGEEGDLLVDRYSDEFTECVANAPELPRSLLDSIGSGYYQEYDWWNNEGGCGYIVIDVENMTYYTHYDLNGEETSEPDLDENGEPDWDNYEPEYSEWTESSSGKFEF